jgi:hypothetical protein
LDAEAHFAVIRRAAIADIVSEYARETGEWHGG